MASRNKASGNSIAGDAVTPAFRRGHAESFIKIVFITLALTFTALLSASVAAQSGRLKDPKPKTKPAQGPIAQPGRPATSQKSPAPIPPPSPQGEAGGDIDPADVIRVSSNLVPIPASVIDTRGQAVSGLKLEDFELSVDG
ncbi:MAG TPA: hypothetical protein VES69_04305, partial [Pyrinomonadaceae bacterium]|nr:hypothetical protein [Pyrinomonadaceae bacterium]